MCDQNIRRVGDQRDRGEVGHGIHLQGFAENAGVDRDRADVAEEDGVPIGRRLRGFLRANDAAGAGTVLDHEGLAELLLKLCGNDAGDGIDSAPRRCAHDDPHGVIGIVRGGPVRLRQGG